MMKTTSMFCNYVHMWRGLADLVTYGTAHLQGKVYMHVLHELLASNSRVLPRVLAMERPQVLNYNNSYVLSVIAIIFQRIQFPISTLHCFFHTIQQLL